MEDNTLRDLEQRLSTIESHLCGIRRMVADNQPCPAVLRQILAVQRALDAVARFLVDDHVDGCLGLIERVGQIDGFERAVHAIDEIYGLSRMTLSALPTA